MSELRVGGLWTAPAAVAGDELVRFGRSPGAGFVLVDRHDVVENRLDDAPLRLDLVLPYKQHRISAPRVSEQSLVRRHVVHGRIPREQLDIFADHGFAWRLDACTERDDDVWAEAEPHVVRLVRRIVED